MTMLDNSTTHAATTTGEAPSIPGDRAMALAFEAWRRYPARIAITARRNHVIDGLAAEQTWWVLGRINSAIRAQAVSWLLSEASAALKLRAWPSARAAGAAGRQSRSASAAPRGRPAPRPLPSLTELADRAAASHVAKMRVERRLCCLDTIFVNGKPIGDCTIGEVRAWAATRGQDARDASRDHRFALSLVAANLSDHEIVRDCYPNPDESDEMYRRAEADHDA